VIVGIRLFLGTRLHTQSMPMYAGSYRAVCWGPDNSLLTVKVNPLILRVFNVQGQKLYEYSSKELGLSENTEQPFDCDGVTWDDGHLLLALFTGYRGGGECKLYSFKLTIEATTAQLQAESAIPCKY